jgi:hypothetical protein
MKKNEKIHFHLLFIWTNDEEGEEIPTFLV